MITAGYIQRFQSTGTSELLDYIFLGAIIPLEAEGCLAPCYLPSRSSPCHSSPCIIGGPCRQWAAHSPRPTRGLVWAPYITAPLAFHYSQYSLPLLHRTRLFLARPTALAPCP